MSAAGPRVATGEVRTDATLPPRSSPRGLPVLSHVSWNLSRRLALFREADVIVLSLGKSGRTWLRVMLHHALALEYGIPFDPIRLEPGRSGAPLVVYTHELATH